MRRTPSRTRVSCDTRQPVVWPPVEGFLVRTTTRLCIDRLRARRRREYVGPWVPEPVDTRGRESPLGESLTQGFPLLLERLSPDERAAFLLRAVFDYEYAEIGKVVGKAEATVRQLVSRARRRLGLDGERRFRASQGAGGRPGRAVRFRLPGGGRKGDRADVHR